MFAVVTYRDRLRAFVHEAPLFAQQKRTFIYAHHGVHGQVTGTMADHGRGENSLDQESGNPSSWSNLNAQSSYCKPPASSTARQSSCAISSTRRSS